eukprot:gene147-32861_t
MAAATAALGRTISFAPATTSSSTLRPVLPPAPPFAALLGFGFEVREDLVRTEAFGTAIWAHCKGRIVLDVGTGDAAVFALEAARAGAARVFAVEGDPASAARARAVVEAAEHSGELRQGLVTVLCCLSTELSLAAHLGGVTPEVVVHELLGHFAGSEGVGYFYDNLRRRLCPEALSIPHRAQTMLAPGKQPCAELLRSAPAARTQIGPGQKYLAIGPQLPLELLLAQPKVGEDLLFNDVRAPGVTVVQGELLEFEVDDSTQLQLESAKRRRTTNTVHARLHASSLDTAPEYRFVFGSGSAAASTATTTTTIALSELYPLTGGDYCRHCGGITTSLHDQESRFKTCTTCGSAYHRACVVKLGWEGLTCGWWSADDWLCGGCRPTEE